jgi:translocation and assembly module TamB
VDNCNAVNTPEQMPLSGKVDINIQDLGALAPLTAYTVQATGGFGGRIDLHGTAARPKLNGTLALSKGAKGEASLYIPATGVTVQGLKLAVEGDGSTNQADLVLTSSGGGTLRAKGTFNRTADQPLAANFSITGERFQAANLPEYQAVISPNLHLVYGKSGAALSGSVAVPKAKIAPLGFSEPSLPWM